MIQFALHRFAIAALISVFCHANLVHAGGTITQKFPNVGVSQTAWIIDWDIVAHGGPSGSETLVIKKASFQRGPNEEPVQVLGDCRLAEMFVPYNGGSPRFHDMDLSMSMVDLTSADVGPSCVIPPKIYDRTGSPATKGPLIVEGHDDGIRWMDATNRTRRGQVVTLWSALDAANYRYLFVFEFFDDGRIVMRVGATAHNLFDSDSDEYTHMHLGCWRLNVVLGAPGNSEILVSSWESTPATGTVAKTVLNTFLGGFEGGIPWSPNEFTKLRIQSKFAVNSHSPPSRIAYDLIPHRQGNSRHYGVGEEFTHNDLWVTNSKFPPEWHPEDLPANTSPAEPLTSDCVIWHMTPLLHIPRHEDFGRIGTKAGDGVALTAWGGFELKPRNFNSQTPLYP